jgi:hypothetical protein
MQVLPLHSLAASGTNMTSRLTMVTDNLPENMTQVDTIVDHILQTHGENAFATMRSEKFEELIMYHHGLGGHIRNTYGFWKPENQGTVRELCKGRIEVHPDEASMVIIEALWRRLNTPSS